MNAGSNNEFEKKQKKHTLFLQQENERLESAGWEVAGPEWSHKVVEVLPGLAAGHNDCPQRPVACQLLLI